MTAVESPHAEVLERLSWDTVAYAENLAFILPKKRSRGLILAVPKRGQLALDAKLEAQRTAGKPQRAIVLKSRRVGMSTWVQIKLIQRSTLTPHNSALVVAHDSETGGKLYGIGFRVYANLPNDAPELKPPIRSHRRSRFLHFAQPGDVWMTEALYPDSTYWVDTAGEFESGRGAEYHQIHASEYGFWPQPEQKHTALMQTVPDEPDTLIVIESTANGHNHFKDLWDDAMEGADSDYAAFFWPWWKEADCRRELSEAAREEFRVGDTDQSPYAEEEPELVDPGPIDTETGEVHPLDVEQLAWRRWAIVNRCGGKVEKFHQEYPACLTAEMRVSTEEGIIPISEAGRSRTTESGPIKRWGVQAVSPIYRLVTEQGRVLRGTADHPVLTDRGLVQLAELQPEDAIELRPPRFAAVPYTHGWNPLPGVDHRVTVDENWARFMGYFMGDGSWSAGTIEFSCDANDPDVVEDVARVAQAVLGREPRRDVVARVQGRKGCVRLRIGCKIAQDAFKALGLIARSGEERFRRFVHVPEAIWRSPQPIVREFLRGLFEADGSGSQNCVRWASYRYEFAQEIQLLLLGFGINVPIRANPKKAGNGAEYVSYVLDLTVADSRRFHDEIGFVGERKRALRPQETHLGRPALIRPLVDRVVQVEPDGVDATWDFTLDTDDHLFMAQGIVTHNTPEQAFLATGRKVFEPTLVARAMAQAEKTDPRVGRGGPVTGVIEAGKWVEQAGRIGKIEAPREPKFKPARLLSPGDTPDWRFWLDLDEQGKIVVPEDDHYVVGVDVSEGLPESEDEEADPAFHAIEVIDHKTKQQVCEYRSRCDPDLLAVHAVLTAMLFNDAWLAIEKTGPGLHVVRKAYGDYHYHFTYVRRRHETKQEREQDLLGWSTDRATKPILLAGGAELLREETHGIKSRRLASEFMTYIRTSTGKTIPERGRFADLLMAYLIAQQVALEKPLRQFKKGKRAPGYIPRNKTTGY